MIEEVIIEGFRGTFLANIRNLHFRFGSPIQIIAGTNGCGKTRLMNEFHFLPPDPKDYYPGGKKEILTSVRGARYRLRSVLQRKAFEHSFTQLNPDGSELELNQGGTSTVQRELVQRIFGLTPLIQSVLSGRTATSRFSGMPYLKRRELFTELCPVDLTYALNVYQQLKTQAAHALGARKTAEKRLASITAQLIDQAEVVALQTQASHFRNELDVLMRNYDQQLNVSPQELQNKIDQLDRELSSRTRAVLQTETHYSSTETPESFRETIELHRQELQRVESTLQSQTQHFTRLNELLLDMANRNGMSLEQVDARLNELKRSLQAFGNNVRSSRTQECGIALEQLEVVKGYLVDCLQSMPNPSSSDLDFSATAATERRAKRKALKDQQSLVVHRITITEDELSHLNHLDGVECPQCSLRFKPGFRPGREEELKRMLTALYSEQDEVNGKVALADTDEQLQVAFEEGLQRLRKAGSEYPRLSELWATFAIVPFAEQNTQSLITEIHRFELFLNEVKRYRDLENEQRKLTEIREQILATEGTSGELITGQARQLELQIEASTSRARELKQLISELVSKVEAMDRLIANVDRVRELATKRSELYQDLIAGERNRLIELTIETHQRSLALVTHRLHEVTVNQALATDLENQIEELKANEKSYAHLLDVLSPSNGLIAEQLSGFIAEFVGKINEIIGKFWTYDLKLYPCGIENAELNYRFPVEIISEENKPSDVSEASWGQKDLIDFAFKLVLALYLQRPEWPIYLDELGATFDETHHRKVLQFVKDYITSGKASMAFIVSHYASSHTAMADAELTILDTSNVTVLKDFNKHVTIS